MEPHGFAKGGDTEVLVCGLAAFREAGSLTCRISRQDIMHTPTHRRCIPWATALVIGALALAPLVVEAGGDTAASEIIHVAIMEGGMDEPSLNDAKVATKIWFESIFAEEAGRVFRPDVQLYADPAAMKAALGKRAADILILGIDEFYALGGSAAFKRVFLYFRDGDVNEPYLLLTRRDGGITSLADLRGRKAILLDNIHTSLAERWLNSLLRRDGLPAVRQLAGKVVVEQKPSKCIQRVFFRNTDVCLVTEKSYRIAVELNPQLGKQLVVLAKSPPFIPSVIAVSVHPTSGVGSALERAILLAHTKQRMRQLFRLFRIERLVLQAGNELASAKALLAETGEAGADDAPAKPAAATPSLKQKDTP